MKSRPPSRRFAGRPGAAPTVAPGDPRAQVGPRTSRPSRGMQSCSPKRWAVTAFRAPGSATVRSAPLSVGWVAPPDNELVIVSRALWSAGTRAHTPVALPRDARERSFSLKARALYITPLCTLRPGILASGFAAARLTGPPRTEGLSGAALCGQTGGTAPASPRPRHTIRTRDSLGRCRCTSRKHNDYSAGLRRQP
jgi:hypothetical protein